MKQEEKVKPLTQAQYMALAEFRYQLRRFLRTMEEQTRKAGVNPQQYQLVLAVKGLPGQEPPTIGRLAERMQLNHNSMVELVDRCERHGLIRRMPSQADRRRVILFITPVGDAVLRKLGNAAREELLGTGPSLVESVLRLTRGSRAGQRRGDSSPRRGVKRKTGP
jgi:DNA-binding MarR family transcriptional regulator